MEILKGKVFKDVFRGEYYGNDAIFFDDEFVLTHSQDCCESVYIESIVGDLSDLEGTPILMSEEVSSEGYGAPEGTDPDSFTWTFFKLATIKGYVDIRFYGTSNGYYSESANLYDLNEQF